MINESALEVTSTYNKHIVEEEDNSGVSFFFLVRISHIEQGSQQSKLPVKGCKCLRKKKKKPLVSIQSIKYDLFPMSPLGE